MYNNSLLKLVKKGDKYILNIKKYIENEYFLKTFLSPLLIKKTEGEKEDIEISLTTTNIVSLEDLVKQNKINLYSLELLFSCLKNQLELLDGYTILNFSPKHIYYFQTKLINQFVYLNVDDVFSVSNDKIMIDRPFQKTKHTAPELKNLEKIPNNKHLKSASYWSLASVIKEIIGKKNIEYTKLFWALQRCFVKYPEHRFLLLI